MVIIVAIRSSKQFFRWLGWGLILSGIITLIPVPFFMPLLMENAAGFPSTSGIEEGQIVSSLVGGLVTSILSGLNLAVFTQVAVVIVIGIVALFLSILLTRPDEVTKQELNLEKAQLSMAQANAGFGSTPRPLQTPAPPPPKYNPADLDDLFADAPDQTNQ
jgi:hypothetical protein